MTANPTTYAAAQALHAAGINVTPVREDGSKAPANRGWQDHTATPEDIDAWFGKGGKHGALGIVTGESSGGLEMTEIEGAYIGRLPEIAEAFHAAGETALWAEVNGGWLERSPSGGLHWFYRLTGMPVPGNVKIAVGEDRKTIAETRGKGGQTVGAPSGGTTHPTGAPWVVLRGGPDSVPTLTEAQRDTFHALLADVLDTRRTPERAQRTPDDFWDGLEAQQRQHRIETQGLTPGDAFELATSWAQILEPHGWTVHYTAGSTIYWTRPGKHGGISATTGHADDRDRLYVFSANADPFPTFEPITKFSAYALLNTGGDHSRAASKLRAEGHGEPAKAAPIGPSAVTNAPAPAPAAATADGTVITMPDPGERETPPRLQGDRRPLSMTDDWNGWELIREHGRVIRFDTHRGRWLVWDEYRWVPQPSTGGRAREYAKDVARGLPQQDPDGNAKAIKHKRYSLSERGITAMLNTARTAALIAVDSDDLDRHALELNTPGGIVDLTTGRISPSDPARLHTRSTAYTPDFEADRQFWYEFLEATFPDEEVRAYIQRLVGHSLLGEVREHVLPFAFGSGGNGKGVLLETLIAVLGSYGGTAPAGFLMANGYQQHSTELAALNGRRFVVTSEVNPRDRFDEARVKSLTGGDTISARFMRQDFFEFKPTHHLWMMGNDQPAVESGGDSFWRRLRLIPFMHTVPEDRKIPDLQGILAREHGPAILAWAIEGAVEYLNGGLRDPETVRAATANYAASTDTVGQFLEDVAIFEDGATTPISALRNAYEDWCARQGETAVQGRTLAAHLARHGVETGGHIKIGGIRFYGGIRLDPDATTPDWLQED